jgi:hypothetical protein
MASSKTKRKRTPKSIIKLPDLEQSKSAVLNSQSSLSSQRTYDHAIREFIASGRDELEQIQFLLGHVSVQTAEWYSGCKQRLRNAVDDRIGLEPDKRESS